jgi:hypothetical protein
VTLLGASAALLVLEPPRARALLSSRGASSGLPLALTPVRLPHPLAIYERMASFLATAPGGQARTCRLRRVPGSTPIP